MNSFGNSFRIEIFGESHGPVTGIALDGVPAGIPLEEEDFAADIARRSPASYAEGVTTRHESDKPQILSGVFNGVTTGAPICIVFKNCDSDSASDAEYERYFSTPRPGHADYAASVKYGSFNDPRGGGQFSGRMTLPLVAAGVVAKKIICPMSPEAALQSVGNLNLSVFPETQAAAEAVRLELQKAREAGDSLGGTVRCVCDNVPAGLGEPFFDSVESLISHLIFSIPGVRGIEFGAGFASANMKGSRFNDLFVNSEGLTASNNAGGTNGGITNGNRLVFTVAFRPPASIARPQQTFNFAAGQMDTLSVRGRHDLCFALRTPVIVEACCACVLADLKNSLIHE